MSRLLLRSSPTSALRPVRASDTRYDGPPAGWLSPAIRQCVIRIARQFRQAAPQTVFRNAVCTPCLEQHLLVAAGVEVGAVIRRGSFRSIGTELVPRSCLRQSYHPGAINPDRRSLMISSSAQHRRRCQPRASIATRRPRVNRRFPLQFRCSAVYFPC
jgi:hypothetical protein